MDPISMGAATGAAKGAGGLVGKQVADVLKRRVHRFVVSKAVEKKAQEDGIEIKRTDLRRWLHTDSVRDRLAMGDPSSHKSLATELEELSGANKGTVTIRGNLLLRLILDESLRRLPDGDANVEALRRTERAIEASEQRIVLASRGDVDAFASALVKLHPWRRDAAQLLANEWPSLRQLVILLASQNDRAGRAGLLGEWATSQPQQLHEAPAGVCTWLAEVASDYGATEAALQFIEQAVVRGAPAAYLWARAGLIINDEDDVNAERAREYWKRSNPPHVLAAAVLALEAQDYVEAERLLADWLPDCANDKSIKAILQTAAAAGLGDFNRTIKIGLDASQANPEASGIALRTAEALMSRAHFGTSDHRLEDFARSFELAIQARDSRRSWLGDSAAAILVAVKAAALATDVTKAWQLTQTVPEGTALPLESSDLRIRREAAILAATMGRFDLARTLASQLGDEYVTRTVAGWEAYAREDFPSAETAWMAAWDAAPNDIARAQTAASLAPLGGALPDLSTIPEQYSEAMDRLRTVHQIMSSSSDQLAMLRAKASESEHLTVLLAERLVAQGDDVGAGAVLEAGGSRWNHPLLMRMAAARYLHAGEHGKAERAALTALSLGGPAWAGRLETLMIEFNAVESLGDFERSLPLAREMVAIAPSNLSVRWALVNCLVRVGDGAGAWNAFSYDSELLSPRDEAEARTWIGLVSSYDSGQRFVQRSLDMMARWAGSPEVVGIYLAQIYSALGSREDDVSEADLRELHEATSDYLRKHPESLTFRSFKIDEQDPLGSISEELRQHAESPQLRDLRSKVEAGELPLGLLSDVLHRSYAEACIKRGAGLVYSTTPEPSGGVEAFGVATSGGSVVVDCSAAVTLALLDSSVVDAIWGSFLGIETTDRVFRDALRAQQSLGLRSTMSLGWSVAEGRARVAEMSEFEAESLARHANRTVELLARSNRKASRESGRFAQAIGDGPWLGALDHAIANSLPFWCDDRLVRGVAREEGVVTFGTVDALRALKDAGTLSADMSSASRAVLIHNFHVDLGFDPDEMRLAAEIAAWEPGGAAMALTRPGSWTDPAAVVDLVCEAIGHTATTSPSAIQGWVWASATGMIRIAGDDHAGASRNLELLLSSFLSQTWLRSDSLPFVVDGMRDALGQGSHINDPLRPVLQGMYRLVAQRHGAPAAAEFTLMLVAALKEEDRAMAANVILTSHS